MNLITPIVLIIVSIATFFMYIDPTYRGQDLANGERSIQSLLAEDAEYQKALNTTTEIRKKRDALIQKRGEISEDNMTKLEKLLPDNVDNIKLVIAMNQIAQNHSLSLKNIKLDTAVKTDPNKIGQDTSKYGTVGLSFTVSSSYDNFRSFLADVEKSQRLVDITDLAVTGNDTGIYEFSVGLKTYWLK